MNVKDRKISGGREGSKGRGVCGRLDRPLGGQNLGSVASSYRLTPVSDLLTSISDRRLSAQPFPHSLSQCLSHHLLYFLEFGLANAFDGAEFAEELLRGARP